MAWDLTRAYRSQDVSSAGTPIDGPFGYGTNFLYNIFLYSPSQAAGQSITSGPIDLVMADGSQIPFSCQSGCTSYTGASFQALNTPDTGWFGATIVYNAALPGWTLTRKDGTVYSFGYGAPLQSIRDRYGNHVTVTRTGGQTGDITQVSASPSGRSLTFHNDAFHHVTSVQDSSRTVSYLVNSSTNQLTSVTDANLSTTTFGYSTSPGFTQNLTSIKDPLLNQATIGYTTAGLLSLLDPPLAGVWTFAYTGAPPSISSCSDHRWQFTFA